MEQQIPKKINLYWVCQLAGWGSAAVYWSYHQIPLIEPLWLGILTVFIPFLMGIGSTHTYKVLAHKKGWIHLDLKGLLPKLIIALTILTLIYLLVNFKVAMLCYGKLTTSGFLGMLTGGIRYISIWLLAFHLYHYARFSRQAEIDQTKYEKLAIAAQFKRLNSELNPHFLFNSLNSVKALILENPKAAREAVDLLSEMLRNALQFSKRQLIPLSEEVKSISSYLALEKIRFEDRLQYKIDIDPDSSLVNIPPLSLYNLVENAVKHGISSTKAGGSIRISSSLQDDKIHLTVINDGTLKPSSDGGTGLKNVAERLRLVYGDPAKLELKAITPNQVSSSLIIPLLR